MSKRIMADAVGLDGVALRPFIATGVSTITFKLLMFQDLNKHIMADGSGADEFDIWSTLARRWNIWSPLARVKVNIQQGEPDRRDQ